MNDDALDFLRRNGVNIDELLSNINCNIYDPDDINGLVAKYGIYKESVPSNISVADIVGDLGSQTSDVFSNFKNLFETNGDGYHTRALGMLDYSADEIIDKLAYSFKEEPICINEIDKGKYVISTNGRHRFTVLKAHYLIELQRANGDLEEIQRLKEKYTIPVRLKEVDFLKTYSNFLIRCADRKYFVMADLDENYEYTGKTEISLGNEKRILDDDELLEFTRASLFCLSDSQKEVIEFLASQNETFNEFLSQNFSIEMNSNYSVENRMVR